MPEETFRFVQFDFPGGLGLPAGRWVVRPEHGEDASHVLIVSRRSTAERKRRRRIKEAPDAITPGITRVTVIDAAGADGTDPEQRRGRALAVIARAMTVQAVAAADHLAQLSPPPPTAVRIGTGSGEQVADGRWSDAFELPAGDLRPKRRRPAPSEGRFAELLGARAAQPACALLALRARSDLEAGREREAVLGIESAIACARSELAGQITPERLEAIVAHAAAAAAAGEEARATDPGGESVAAARAALERVEAALRSLA